MRVYHPKLEELVMNFILLVSSAAWADEAHAHWAGEAQCAIVHTAECSVFFGAALELEHRLELHAGIGPVLVLEEEAEVGVGMHAHARLLLSDRVHAGLGVGLHVGGHLGLELSVEGLYAVTANTSIGPGLQLRLHESEFFLWHERVIVSELRWRQGLGHEAAVSIALGGAYHSAADISTGIVENHWSPAFGLGFEMHF